MSKKKVITVSGDSSKWYDKVIFVVKNESVQKNMNIDFVMEAENIISDYMLNKNMEVGKVYNKNANVISKNKSTAIDTFFYSSITICIVLLSILLYTSF